jgi:hypothetical protein
MASSEPREYGAAWEKAQTLLRQGRLNDPGEHFPYKHDDVTALVEENPPMGPDGPDDDRLRAEDFTSAEIADATRDYVQAQEAYLRDPGDGTAGDYRAAAEALVAARQAHRANRTQGPTIVGIRARRAGE